MKNRKLTRRHFLKLASAAGVVLTSCVGAATSQHSDSPSGKLVSNSVIADTGLPNSAALEPDPTKPVYLPSIYRQPTPTPTPTRTPTAKPSPSASAKVTHVYDPNAVTWNYWSGWWCNAISQAEVDKMVDAGIMALTGKSTLADAWRAILPKYQTGERIAIKVNLNNAQANDADNVIDATMHPVNAVIRGLVAMGVQAADVWVYDNSRNMSARFMNQRQGQALNAHYVDGGWGGGGAAGATYTYANNNQKNAVVSFNKTGLAKNHKLPDLLVDARYLINIPLLKDHDISGVTLGFKNHYGSINYVTGGGNELLHTLIRPVGNPSYSSAYSPLVDLFANPNIGLKTVLTIGDGLLGKYGFSVNSTPPARWKSINNGPANSLFFSTDPVAVDCVMLDILDAEPTDHPQRPGADDYLKLAERAGMGVYERGKPWSTGYTKIGYQRIAI